MRKFCVNSFAISLLSVPPQSCIYKSDIYIKYIYVNQICKTSGYIEVIYRLDWVLTDCETSCKLCYLSNFECPHL